jgi:hypothetical protein
MAVSRAIAAAVAAVALGGCKSDTDKIAERIARQQLSSQYLVVALSVETCDFARRLAASDPGSAATADGRCKAASEARSELDRLEKAYLEACRGCAPAERCRTSLSRLRQAGGRAEEGTACP